MGVFVVLTTVVGAMLSRWYGPGAVVLHTPIPTTGPAAHRTDTVPLILKHLPNADLKSWLVQVKETVAAAYRYQDFSLASLSDRYAGNRLGNVRVAYDGVHPHDAAHAGRFGLSFRFRMVGETIQLELGYDPQAYPREFATALATGWLHGMEWIERLELPLAQVDLIDAGTAEHLIGQLGGNMKRWDGMPNVPSAFEAAASKHGSSVAVQRAGESLSYGELNAHANRLARHLREQYGIREGDVVAVMLPRGLDLAIGLVALLKAGAAYLPMDPSYPAVRIRQMVQEAQPRLLLVNSDMLGNLDAALEDVPIFAPDIQLPMLEEDAGNLNLSLSPETPAYIIYTSGSTGIPKGAVIPHKAILRLVLGGDFAPLVPGDKLLPTGAISFDASTYEMWGTLLNGATLVLGEEDVFLDAHRLSEALSSGRITHLWLTASLFNQLADGAPAMFAHLKYLLVGGDRLSPPHIAQVLASCPGLQVVNGYGPTENTTFSACHRVRTADCQGEIPLGRPIPYSRCYVLDQALKPVPAGVPGEIWLAGEGLALGYLGRPGFTAERFVPDPFHAGARMYRSGDLGRWNLKGDLEFLGRIDRQVKVRGFRVEPGETESALMGYPLVTRAVVAPLEAKAGEPELAAWYVASAPLDPVALRGFLETRLPAHQVPAWLHQVDEIPLTPNGKTDYAALPDPRKQEGAGAIPPRSPLEAELLRIWEAELGVTGTGVEDDFFQLGGHSLKAVRLSASIATQLGLQVGIGDIFSAPTVAGIAARLEARGGDSPVAGNIPQVPEAPFYAASHAQKRLWLLYQMDPGSPAYNMPAALRIEGDLDAGRMQQAFALLVARHEAFRTRFLEVAGEPMMVVDADAAGMAFHDLSGESDPEAAARVFVAKAVRAPFDLERGPLVRMDLLRLAPQAHVLVLNLHHIVSDGWSLAVLGRELRQCYTALGRGEAVDLPPLPIQYRDFAAWHNDRLAQAEGRAYWQEQLRQHLPEVLDLAGPAAPPRPALQTFDGDTLSFTLSPVVGEALRELCRTQGTTLFVGLATLLKAFLYRLTGQGDIILGTVAAGREHPDLAHVLGFFVNTLPLRNQLNGSESFQSLLGMVRETVLGALAHPDWPFDRMVEDTGVARDPARNPLFDVMMTLDEDAFATEMGKSEWEGLAITPMDEGFEMSKFDLQVNFDSTVRTGIAVGFNYNTQVFDRAIVEAMAAQFMEFAESAVAGPNRSVATLPLMGTEEAEKITAWGKAPAGYDAEASIPSLFAAMVAAHGDSCALRWAGASVSYAELDATSNCVAAMLLDHGVRPGTPVAFIADRGVKMVAGILGILKAGAGYVPIDPAYPSARIQYILEDSGAKVVLQHSRLDASQFVPVGGGVRILEFAQAYRYPATRVHVPIPADSLAYIIYTSGSTGRPKGVMNTHRNVVRLLENAAFPFDFGPNDTWALFHSFCFDFSVWEIFGALLKGGGLVLVPEEVAKLTPEFVSMAVAEGVTILNQTPTAFHAFARHALETGADLSLLRMVIFGGEALEPHRLQGFHAAYPHVRLINMYGITETTVHVTLRELHAEDLNSPHSPIGGPISTLELYLLDHHLQPVPTGRTGEIYVGGAGLARGYHGRPGLTAERFVPHPWTPGERLYRSGDLGYWGHDGELYYLGRKDRQVKVRGYRIELSEIALVLEQHPLVTGTVVRLVPRPNGEGVLVAWYTARHENANGHVAQGQTEDVLRKWAGSRLPTYMVPSHFVAIPAFPRTPNGKIDVDRLPDPFAGGAADRGNGLGTVERELAALWGELIGQGIVPQLHAGSNFFEVGGHSLLTAQLAAAVRKAYQIDFPLRDFFLHATLGEQAALIASTRDGVAASIGHAPELPAYPMSSQQERMYVLSRFEEVGLSYNMPMALELEGDWDLEGEGGLRLEQVLRQLIARHEALRTSFELRDGAYLQFIHPQVDFELELGIGLENGLQTAMGKFIRPFDLGKAPLFRAALLRNPSGAPVLALDIHHILSDGLTTDILGREFRALWEGETLPAPTFQYKDYAWWQRQQLSSGGWDAHAAYWKDVLAGELPVLDLPTDFARPAVKSFEGAVLSIDLPAPLWAAIRARAAVTAQTPFMMIAAAWGIVLSKYARQAEVIIGIPIAGRSHSEWENVVGMFINTLPLRIRALPHLQLDEFVHSTGQSLLEGYSHQDYPFEAMLDLVQVPRNLSRNPVFDVLCTHRHSVDTVSGQGREASSPSMELGISKFDISLSVLEEGETCTAVFEYATKLFLPQTMERMAGHFLWVLAAIAENPAQRLGQLSLCDPETQRLVLEGFNRLPRIYPDDQPFISLFENRAAQQPHAVAIVDKGESISYADLNRRAASIASVLRTYSPVGDTSYVGLMAEPGHALAEGVLAILKAGKAIVPLGPTIPDARVAFMLQNCGIRQVLATGKHLPRLRQLAEKEGLPLHVHSLEGQYAPVEPLPTQVDLDQDCYLIFTSGTTGEPKGVPMTYGNISAQITGFIDIQGMGPGTRVLNTVSYTFDFGLFELMTTFAAGATWYALNRTESRVGDYVDLAISAPADIILCTPSFFREIAAMGRPLPNLHVLHIGGELLDRATVAAARGIVPRDCLILNGYGPTECACHSTYFAIRPEMETEDLPVHIPIGRASPNKLLFVLDEGLQPLPVGVPGELYVGGTGLSRGYHGDAGLSAQKFIPSPFAGTDRLYRTGDLVRWAETGDLIFMGRIDQQVKVRGHRIELGEIEVALAAHPQVSAAAVVDLRDAQGDAVLAAYYVSTARLLPETLRKFLGATLPEYMVPAHFVALERIPLNASGKVDRKALPSPDLYASGSRGYMAPRNETETYLAELWGSLLGLKKVGILEGFFELGGSSLKVVRMLSLLEPRYPGRLRIHHLFDYTTIESLAAFLVQGEGEAPASHPAQEGQARKVEF